MRTLMPVDVVPGDGAGGVKFVARATRFAWYMDVPMDDLRSWLPPNTVESDVRRWSGCSPKERESTQGLEGLFHSTDEVDEFVARLASALERRSVLKGGGPARFAVASVGCDPWGRIWKILPIFETDQLRIQPTNSRQLGLSLQIANCACILFAIS